MKNTSKRVFRSTIFEKMMKLTEKIYSLLINGFLGKIFTSYSAEERMLRESCLFSRVRNFGKTETFANALKLGMARFFETSFIFGAVERLTSSLIYRKLKTYGAFLFSLGAYGMITYIVRFFAYPNVEFSIRHFVVCAVILFLALPLMSSKETLAEALLNSKILSLILFDGFGIPRDTLTKRLVYPKQYAAVTILGMVLGVLTCFIDPIYYVFGLAAIIGTLVVFRYPEIGIIVWVALLPFVGMFEHGSLILAAAVLVTDISYLIKLIRGKRAFRLGLIDYAIVLFSIIYFVSGIISKGGIASFRSALMYVIFLSGYFLIVNLLRTPEWIRRCVVTGVLSGAVSCFIGILQIFTGTLNTSWLDTSVFSEIGTRIVSLFDNPNIFAEYLILVIPFAMACLLRKGKAGEKVMFGCSLLLMLICLIFTWSRGAWLGFLVGAVVFFFVLSQKTLPCFLGLILVSPLLSWLIPNAVAERFLSIGNLAESSVSYRISAWHGVVELLKKTWCSGIGVGTAAFNAVYPSMALAGVERIEHAHNIYLQLLTELGIPGLLVFFIIIFEC